MSIPPDDWARVRSVFEHALTVPESERSDYVAGACSGSAGMRQQVERMLASHAKATAFLETPIAVSLADLTVATNLEGTQIGPYQLGARIGAGGMGEVYSARDTRLGRTVAIKVLPSHIANDPQARERFDREARAIAALNHPHICVLHDVGEATVPGDESPSGDQEPVTVRYLVMELLEGETLADRLARGPLPLDEAMRLRRRSRRRSTGRTRPESFIAISSPETSSSFRPAAPHRHSSRSCSTSGSRNSRTRPGLVGRVEPAHESVTRPADLTTPGIILGTLQYMAPEQIEGGQTDARTDVFAFGLVLFEMLTGRKAFEADSRRALMVAILDGEPAPLSALQPAAPRWLDDFLQRCLAKNPDERWQTAQDVLLELQARHDSSPVPVPPPRRRVTADREQSVARSRWSP